MIAIPDLMRNGFLAVGQELIKRDAEIDRLTAEKFCPDCGCKMSLWCEKDVKERMDAKNKQLQAENMSKDEELIGIKNALRARGLVTLLKEIERTAKSLKG